MEHLPGGGLGPELQAAVTEQFHRLLALLNDDALRRVALWKMEGHTDGEIAERLGCAVPPWSANSP